MEKGSNSYENDPMILGGDEYIWPALIKIALTNNGEYQEIELSAYETQHKAGSFMLGACMDEGSLYLQLLEFSNEPLRRVLMATCESPEEVEPRGFRIKLLP